jgi:hypothetical protein
VPSGSGYASIAALKGSDGSARSLENTGINSSPAVCRKTPFFDKLRAVRGCTGIFDGCKPLKMGAIRKPRCRTGRPNAAERRDARERRANGDGEKAMDGFFDKIQCCLNWRIFGPVTVYSDFPLSQAIWLKSLNLAAG